MIRSSLSVKCLHHQIIKLSNLYLSNEVWISPFLAFEQVEELNSSFSCCLFTHSPSPISFARFYDKKYEGNVVGVNTWRFATPYLNIICATRWPIFDTWNVFFWSMGGGKRLLQKAHKMMQLQIKTRETDSNLEDWPMAWIWRKTWFRSWSWEDWWDAAATVRNRNNNQFIAQHLVSHTCFLDL